jgi:hypothetical protein
MYLLSFAPPESLTEFSARADALKTKKPATAAQQISKADFFTFSELLQHLDELQVLLFLLFFIAVTAGRFVADGMVPFFAGPVERDNRRRFKHRRESRYAVDAVVDTCIPSSQKLYHCVFGASCVHVCRQHRSRESWISPSVPCLDLCGFCAV